MTSPSPTRRRTTPRRSIREPGGGRTAAAIAAALIALAALPAVAGWRDLQRSEPPPPVVPETAAATLPVAGAEPVADEGSDGAAALILPAAVETPADDESTDACAEEAADCRAALEKLRADSLAGIDLDIRVGGRPGNDYPYECRLEGETFEPRRFATTTFTWKAAGYCHKPLYFEHWNLERYGHSHGFVADSFLSAAHFFARIPALPYQMGVELPWECVYPLGYYRPGSCAPWTVPAVPVSARGFAVGAAAATGIVFLLP
ncbi:MAG: hypothetical protein ACKON7_03335 [Planctomycetaceae bacterium]